MKFLGSIILVLFLTACAPRCPNGISVEPLWLDSDKKMSDVSDYINNSAGLMISLSWDWNGTFYGNTICQMPKIIRKDIKNFKDK